MCAPEAAAGSSIDRQIRAAFGPAHDDTAVCVSHAEDPRRDPAAVSPTFDHGIFQVHVFGGGGRSLGGHFFSIAELHTVSGSIRAALVLSRGGRSFGAWTGTYGKGMCRGLS